MLKKQVLAVLFATLLLLNNLGSQVILAFYVICPKSFVEMFCENTDKPEMHCNGQCELKRLAHTPEQQTGQTVIVNIFSKYLVFYNTENLVDYSSINIEKPVKITSFYLNNYDYLFADKSFRPPVLS